MSQSRKSHTSKLPDLAFVLAMAAGLALTASCAADLGDAEGPDPDDESLPSDSNDPSIEPESPLPSQADTSELLELTTDASDMLTEVGELLSSMVIENGATFQIQAPTGCTADISVLQGQITFREGCVLPSGLLVEGNVEVRLGGCSGRGITAEVDVDLLDPNGLGVTASLDGQLKIAQQDGLIYVRTSHSIDAAALGQAASQSGQGCYALSPLDHQVAVSGTSTLSLPGGEQVEADLSDLEAKLCETIPSAGTATFSGHHQASLTFTRLSGGTVALSGAIDGQPFNQEVPVDGWGLCAGGAAPASLGANLATCGGCAAGI